MPRRKADVVGLDPVDVVVKRHDPPTAWAAWFERARCRCDLTRQRIAELTGISVYSQRRWAEDGDLPSIEELRRIAEATGSEYVDLLLVCGYIAKADIARLVRRAHLPPPGEDRALDFPGLGDREQEARIDHRELAAVRVAGGELTLCAERAEGHDPLVLSKYVSDDGARTDVWFTREGAQEALGLFKEGQRVVKNWFDRQGAWSAYGNQRIRLGTCEASGRTLMVYVELEPGEEPRVVSASSAPQAPSSRVEFTRPALAEFVDRLREGVFLLRRWG
ncbi:MAG: helix-turn-helix domain-containing protein [Segniliparus sp.]|uniref:helix-turn-helix domain-containing protein n=1 Tax=Segniliparus sp. TaxID=2804064 RepID=UPI003F31EAF9